MGVLTRPGHVHLGLLHRSGFDIQRQAEDLLSGNDSPETDGFDDYDATGNLFQTIPAATPTAAWICRRLSCEQGLCLLQVIVVDVQVTEVPIELPWPQGLETATACAVAAHEVEQRRDGEDIAWQAEAEIAAPLVYFHVKIYATHEEL